MYVFGKLTKESKPEKKNLGGGWGVWGVSEHTRVLARNFKTCVRDSLLGIIWRPRMKSMCTGIRI